jgi:glycolate oxidase
MVRAIHSIAAKYQLRIGTFGHFGDGNLHPTFLVDERNSEEMSRVHEAMGELFTEALKLNGTITGEHGVGLAKRPYLPAQLDESAMRLLRELKRVLDPQGILNPGKIFSAETSHPAKRAEPQLAATTA